MAELSSEHVQFAKALAHTSKKTRDGAMATLRAYLQGQQRIERLELLRLWKGLFYCMWLADKAPVQRELADAISDLMHVFPSQQLALEFARAFLTTVVREWSGIDYLRVDKYYTFIRLFVRHVFAFLKDHAFNRELVDAFTAALQEEVLTKLPNGVRLHVADLYLQELCNAAGADVGAGAFFQLLEPFVQAATRADDAVFQGRVVSGVFRQFLTMAADSARDTEADSAADPAPHFAHVTLQQMQAKVFQMAADPETKGKFRAELYAVHRDYQQATGEKTVSPDVIPSNDSGEAVKTPGKRKRAAAATPARTTTATPAAATPAAATETGQKKRKKAAKAAEEESKQEVPAATEKAKPTKKAAGAAANGATPTASGTKRGRKEAATAAQQEEKQPEPSSPAAERPAFIASRKFAGAKPGYVFKKDSKGVGYYLDKVAKKATRKKRVSFGSNEQRDYKDSVRALKKAVVNISSTPTKGLLKKPGKSSTTRSQGAAAAKSGARKKAKAADYF